MIEEINIKDRILQDAGKLVMKFGVRSVSMDDIASELGISKKTIYLYYKDKDALVDEIVEQHLNTQKNTCDTDVAKSENAVQEIIFAMDMMEEMQKTMNEAIMYDLQKYHPRSFTRLRNFKQAYLLSVMKANLQRGIREKLYRPEIDIDAIAQFRVASIFLPFEEDFQRNMTRSLAETVRIIMMHYLHGIVSEKGRETLKLYKATLKKYGL